MYCGACGNPIHDGAKYCQSCGAPVSSEPAISDDKLPPASASTTALSSASRRSKLFVVLLVVLLFVALLIACVFVWKSASSDSAQVSAVDSGDLELALEVNDPRKKDGVVVWDCVSFGKWDGAPILWRVLSVNGNEALLLSDGAIESFAYDSRDEYAVWEDCEMRSWLNSYDTSWDPTMFDYSGAGEGFYNAAFSSEEAEAICVSRVENDDNERYGTTAGSDTEDKVFLLSIDEVSDPAYGFDGDPSAKDAGRQMEGDEWNCGYWWLRSPGSDPERAAGVNADGYVMRGGNYKFNEYVQAAARPAIRVDLRSPALHKEGIVSS